MPSKRVNAVIDKNVEMEFRQCASLKNGFEQGWYSKCIEEAIQDWTRKQKEGLKNE